MAKKNYDELADKILDLIGSGENITYATHCATRLRLEVKDQSLVETDRLKATDGVFGVQWSGVQLQIIIGQDVGDVYDFVCKKTGLARQKAIDENLDEKKDWSLKAIAMRVLDYVTGSLTPLVPVLVACGMVKTIIVILNNMGITATTSPTLTVLAWIGDAGFYFFPILIGKNAAKKLGANEGLGMLLGAILIHPTFINGIAAGEAFSIFGLSIYGVNYKASVFPILLCVAVMAPIQKFFGKYSPKMLRGIIEPTLTLLVMAPISLCVLAPIGGMLSNSVANVVIWLYDTFGFVGVGLFTGLFPIIVMFGMHTALIPYMVTMMSTVGKEGIYCTASWISNLNQGAACLAVAWKTKDAVLRSTATSCAVTAIVGGISEPAFFGVTLRLKTPFVGVICGNVVGGLIAGFFKVHAYAIAGSGGIFGLPVFIGPTASNLICYLAAIAIGMVVTFLVTVFLYKPEVSEV